MKEKKIDKIELLKKIRLHQDGGKSSINVIEDGESQFNDVLLDENIIAAVDEDEDDITSEEQIANEAQHANIPAHNNNMYKFRGCKDHLSSNERPKTSGSINRPN